MDFLSNLPNEVLLEIFSYCKILSLTFVCKKFNNLINNAPSLMRKVNLVISEKADELQLITSERQHQAIYFKFNYRIREDCLKVLNTFRGIKSLEFVRCIVSYDLFTQMLLNLDHLETITIITTYLKEKENVEGIEPPQLTKLKSLCFRGSDVEFLNLLRNSRLEKLFIVFPPQYPLKKLTDFLSLQANIKIIECLDAAEIDGCIMKIIAQEMRSLEKLSLDIGRLNMEEIENLNLKNTSVRSLSLNGNGNRAFSEALNIFTRLKVLKIEWTNLFNAESVSQLQQTPLLESLHIAYCSGDYFNHIQLQNLKQLHFSNEHHTSEEWTNLAIRNPSIEKVVVRDASMTNELFRTICLEFRNLRHLEINYYVQQLTSDILNFICSTTFPTNIRILKIPHGLVSTEDLLALTDEQKNVLNANIGFQFFHN